MWNYDKLRGMKAACRALLALGLAAFKGLNGTEYHLMMAASVAVLLPIIVIFFLAQRRFIEGIATSGIKA